jgi:glyoxylase-like metal-dependent hydrolase (beta-lactamase superfamily II)
MKIGPYELFPIETGTFALDGGAMFGVVPKPLWEKTNPPDEKNRIALAARALLIVGNGRKILVDVGNGSKYNEKLTSIYKFDTSKNTIFSSLKKHQLAPEDITDVILTHLHFDHAGGSTVIDNGELRPAFLKATYYVQRDHWNAALNATERDRASFFKDDFNPLKENNVLQFTEGEDEIFPGISVRIVNGHTTALQCPLITDGKSTLFYCADLMPTTTHVNLPWIMAYDLRPLVTLEEKRKILDQAADQKWTLFFEHDPLTAASTIKRTDRGIVLDSAIPM